MNLSNMNAYQAQINLKLLDDIISFVAWHNQLHAKGGTAQPVHLPPVPRPNRSLR